MIVCSRCKGNSNIRKLLNKLSSVVTKTAVKLDQYEEKLKEMETKLDDVMERIVEVEKVKPTERAWVKEEVKKSFADAAKQGVVPGILPVTSRMIKEQIQQQRTADDRKANMMIFKSMLRGKWMGKPISSIWQRCVVSKRLLGQIILWR